MLRRLLPLLVMAVCIAAAGCAVQRQAKVTYEPSYSFVRDGDPAATVGVAGKTAAVMETSQDPGDR